METTYMTYQETSLRTTTLALQERQLEIPALLASVRVTPEAFILRTTTGKLRPLALYIRNSSLLRFNLLADIAVVDKIRTDGRFTVNYLFLSETSNQRLTIQLSASETTTIPSLAAPFVNAQRVFASASWLEREVWDLFGLYFSEHGDLRRILTDYGFTGHPLRKDFPLTGFHEVVYNDAEGRVVAEPVELAQEFRVFHL